MFDLNYFNVKGDVGIKEYLTTRKYIIVENRCTFCFYGAVTFVLVLRLFDEFGSHFINYFKGLIN
jgi:hypothetical protein